MAQVEELQHSQEFDGYHRWLGIPSYEQPPHHYRLLGIPLFEMNAEVIDIAAGTRLTGLRQQQSGAHAAQCAQIMNQIAQARLCLLNKEKKFAYDQWLNKTLQVKNHTNTRQAPDDEIDVPDCDAEDTINLFAFEVAEFSTVMNRLSGRSSIPAGIIFSMCLGAITLGMLIWHFDLLPHAKHLEGSQRLKSRNLAVVRHSSPMTPPSAGEKRTTADVNQGDIQTPPKAASNVPDVVAMLPTEIRFPALEAQSAQNMAAGPEPSALSVKPITAVTIAPPEQPSSASVKLTASQVSHFKGHEGHVTRIAFPSTLPMMISTGRDGRVLAWNLMAGSFRPTQLAGFDKECWALAVNSNVGPLVAYCENHWQFSSYIQVTNVTTNKRVQQLNPNRFEGINVQSLDFSPDGLLLAGGTSESALRLWNTVDYKEATALQAIDNIRSVAFGPVTINKKEKLRAYPLAVGCNNGAVQLYQVTFEKFGSRVKFGFELAPLQPQVRPDYRITCVAYSPDGKVLGASGDRGEINLWNIRTGNHLGKLAPTELHTVEWIDFHSSQPWALTAHGDGSAQIWNVENGRSLLHLAAHPKSLLCAEFTPDGRYFATASADSTLKLWELKGQGVPLPTKSKQKSCKKS